MKDKLDLIVHALENSEPYPGYDNHLNHKSALAAARELQHIVNFIRSSALEEAAKTAIRYEPIERHPALTYASDAIRKLKDTK